MLVKKSVLDEKSRYIHSRFQGLKEHRIDSISKLDDLQNLLMNLSLKINLEKVWLLYEFPFSSNPGDKANDIQT